MKRIPRSEVYGNGVGLDIDPAFYEQTSTWRPHDDICWDRNFQLSPQKLNALATVATQFHFGKLIDLKLCGRVLERASDMDTKRLALLLATSRMQGSDVWGRCLSLLNETDEIVPSFEYRMGELYDDATDPVSLLIGMVIAGEISGSLIMDELTQLDDPLISDVAAFTLEQAEANRKSAVTYLQRLLKEMPENRLTKIRQETWTFRRSFNDVLYAQEPAFQELGIDTSLLATRVSTEIDIFTEIITH